MNVAIRSTESTAFENREDRGILSSGSGQGLGRPAVQKHSETRITEELMKIFVTVLVWGMSICALSNSQNAQEAKPDVEEHIRKIASELPTDSTLRRELLSGARGDGVHYAWMDTLRKADIRRVEVSIAIQYKRNGKPKKTTVVRTECFTQYENGIPILCSARFKTTGADGLEQALDNLALQRAEHGAWADVPHPHLHPFTGGIRIEFFDDEWLPTWRVPLYCAGPACLSGASRIQR
jgi:hypothetical protein